MILGPWAHAIGSGARLAEQGSRSGGTIPSQAARAGDRITVYRALLAIAVLANFGFAWAHTSLFQEPVDPIALRVALSLLVLVFLAGTFVSAFARKHIRGQLIGLVYAYSAHTLFLSYKNELGFFSTISVVMLLGALAASFPFTFSSLRSLSVYLGLFALSAAVLVALAEAPLRHQAIFALTVLCMEFVCFTALFFRYRALEAAEEAEARLDENASKLRRYDFIVNTSREFMTLISRDYVYEAVNESYITAHHKLREEIIGRSVSEIWSQDLFEKAIRPHLDQCFAGEDVNYQLPLQFPDRPSRFYDISYYPYRDEAGEITHAVVVTRDITEQHRAEERLRFEALHDPLTGLPNRSLFMQRVQRSLEALDRRPDYGFAVLVVDLDRFKNVNESLGHDVGDRMILETARRLQEVVRRVDTTARLGGDEFAILINGARRPEDAIYVAGRIIARMSEPFELEGVEIFAAAAVGITISSAAYKDAQQILRDADTARYRAKQSGGARFEVFRREMHLRALSLLHMGADLRRALARGELVVHYMPIVDLATRQVRSVEALVRWMDPHRGMIQPTRFIRFAEETGIILEIGKEVLRLSCEQAHRWRERGFNVRVAVNFSARQFQMENLGPFLKGLLAEWKAPADSLELEITESAFIGQEERAVVELTALRNLGIRLAIDDFGTGYSSLSYLRRFPFHVLKVDRSFVQDSHEGNGRSILRAIVTMAHEMGLSVTAEGVETDNQMTLMSELGVNSVQGYYFSPPVPAAELTAILEAGPAVGREFTPAPKSPGALPGGT